MNPDYTQFLNNHYFQELVDYINLNKNDEGTNFLVLFTQYKNYSLQSDIKFIEDIIVNRPEELKDREGDDFIPSDSFLRFLELLNALVKKKKDTFFSKSSGAFIGTDIGARYFAATTEIIKTKVFYNTQDFISLLKKRTSPEVFEAISLKIEQDFLLSEISKPVNTSIKNYKHKL